jgi:pimeloyl-ACP methyl ester carboxylesterase
MIPRSSRFLAANPYRHVKVEGVTWEYIACGSGDEALLVLPGAPGRADSSFGYALALGDRYRVIAPSYPSQLRNVDDCIRGLAAILDTEGVGQVSVIGGSYSGLLAQSFVRRYPDRVLKLVLSDTGVPRKARARRYRVLLLLLMLLPMAGIRFLMWLGAELYLREMSGPDKDFWRRYFADLRAAITKEDCASRLRVWISFDSTERFTRRDLQSWPGDVLILEAEHDAVFTARERATLRRLYPRAKRRVFSGGGHAASIDRRDEYTAAIASFLDGGAYQGTRAQEIAS